jgi:hypothetical protein
MAQYEQFNIDQGSDVAIELHLVDASNNPKNLTNFTGAATIKRNYNSDSADTTPFTFAINTPTTDGIITLSLTNQQTDALRAGRYVFDTEIQYTDSNGAVIVERILEGKIVVSPAVTL